MNLEQAQVVHAAVLAYGHGSDERDHFQATTGQKLPAMNSQHASHLFTQRFSLMGTVLTKVIMRMPVQRKHFPPRTQDFPPRTSHQEQAPHLFTQRFSLMGTVLTKVIIFTPLPSWMVMALLLGSMALAVTGTLSTAVQSHILFTGLLWMLQQQKWNGNQTCSLL
jgi:hypothetical protein